MNIIGSITRSAYNFFVKDPVTVWTGKNDSEPISGTDVAKAYAIGMTSPIWAPLALLSACSIYDEKYVPDGGAETEADSGVPDAEDPTDMPDTSTIPEEDSGSDSIPETDSGTGEIPDGGTDTGPVDDGGTDATDSGTDTPVDPMPETIIKEFILNGLGDTIMDQGDILAEPLSAAGGVPYYKTVKVSFESAPVLLFQELADEHGDGTIPSQIMDNLPLIDGFIDITPVAFNPFAQQVNLGTEAAPYYIKDPSIETNRIPAYIGEVNFVDLTGKTDDADLVCTTNDTELENCSVQEECYAPVPDECNEDTYYDMFKLAVCDQPTILEAACEHYRVAPLESYFYSPHEYFLSPQSYEDDLANLILRHTLRTNAENYEEGHDYAFAGKMTLTIFEE